ncbi:MAG: type II secretion system protein GspE, partial [Gammaproteobacteria bacterium]
YLLSSALVGVVAQRLVRTICPACKTSYRPTTEMLERYEWKKSDKIRLYKGRGCSECYDSGYKGRVAIHEVLVTDRELQQLVMRNPSRDELVDFMKASGGKTLFEDGLDRVREGRTTLEEVMRAIAIG